ncbi:MAG: hypothetical protein JOY98_16275 [Candidatus Eremiobacteraeota bacterium]|nr:hypothetical protein [Candidatus Eremiobacteraeota bacterium]
MGLSALFAVFYAAALVLCAADIVGKGESQPKRFSAGSAVPYVAVLLASYAATLLLVWYAATHQHPWPAWRTNLPFPVVARTADSAQLIAAAMLGLGAVQCWALVAVYRRRVPRAALVTGVAVLLLLSLCEPALISPDPYSYVADALLGPSAYAPPATRFAGEYGAINDGLGVPLPPSPYGPLWIALARMTILAASSLVWQVLAFRALGAALFLAFLAGLAALRVPARIFAVAALNPGLMLQYVMNAHNEIFCITCVVWAAAVVRRTPAGAAAALVVAALVKLPFALLGLPIFVAVRSIAMRWTLAVAVIAAACALSWLGGGPAYLRALTHHLPFAGIADILGVAASACALLAIAGGVAMRRRWRSAVWLFPLMGSYPTPWYAAWGLGYALKSRTVTAYLLVWFPLASLLVDTMFMQVWTLEFVVPAIALACAVGLSRAERKPS